MFMFQVLFAIGRLYASHFAGFQSPGADVYALRFAVDEDPDFLDVNPPRAARFVVGVRHVVAFSRAFARNETFARHDIHLPRKKRCRALNGSHRQGCKAWLRVETNTLEYHTIVAGRLQAQYAKEKTPTI
jgi:hypothetical protein